MNPGIGRGGNVVLADDIQEQICDMYQEDKKSAFEIARKFDVTPKTVYRTLRRNDIPVRSKSSAMYLRHARRSA